MLKVRQFLEKINIEGIVRFDEPMSAHTSFRIGGPADAFVRPANSASLARLYAAAFAEGIAVFVLGGGANILVGDRGVRGIVLDTGDCTRIDTMDENKIVAEAGASMEALCEAAVDSSLSGLEFIYGMPGSAGGSLRMNARCYGVSISERFESAELILGSGAFSTHSREAGGWGYKKSPFPADSLILRASFRLKAGERETILGEMREKKADRERKGQYRFPCAGSVFKNDTAFGEPTGRILDRLGFRGKVLGRAKVSDEHANIFVNPGGASAADMKKLIDLARETAFRELGLALEPEVIFVGDF